METLGGFPNLPALWLRRAKPAFAYASSGRLTVLATLWRLPVARAAFDTA